MKLRTALNTILETRYLITGICGSKYEDVYLIVDYTEHDIAICSKALRLREELEKDNPRVYCITYNHAEKCIEITIK